MSIIKKERILFLTITVSSFLTLSVSAQSDNERHLYAQAEAEYRVGRLDRAQQLLTENLGNLRGNLKVGTYRLLTLCYLGLDRMEEAESSAVKLLQEDPYYTTTVSDPKRFSDLIERIKAGLSNTITTASSRAENLSEVPVPTTLITEEMIANSGARNLQELLAAFVPGMTIVDCNDDMNIAMRGIYSNSQEKILIMLNGHRLNSYCTNIAAPDYSMSIEKIKQIEVLRGPASSLYGGVALTAVVNIITKQGADVDGVKVRAGGGSYGTLRGDALFGKRYFDLDILIWASGYKSDGQRFDVSGDDDETKLLQKNSGEIIVGGVGNKPSYDVGINMKWKDLMLMYNTRFSQLISPYTMSYLFSPYDVDRYKTYNGIKPSFATQNHHAEVGYGKEVGNLFMKGTFTYDNSDLTHYQVISDDPMPLLGFIINLPDDYMLALMDKDGLSRYINGQEQTFGAQLKGDFSYNLGRGHKGSISFGGEFDHFSLDDTRYVIGHSFNSSISETDRVANESKGHENSFNTFAQLKHHWHSFIVNAGLRFDYKNRYDGSHINEYSPRLALIFVQPKWNVKLSYSKAFIDAPYLYRKTNNYLQTITGKIEPVLSPEVLHSYQLTFAGSQWINGLDLEFNTFYNRARNLIFMQIIDHQNTGYMDTYGLEFSGNYTHRKFTANMTAAWQKLRKGTVFNYELDDATNIPTFSANLVMGWQPFKDLKLHSHVTYASKQTSYSIDLASAVLKGLLEGVTDDQAIAMMKDIMSQFSDVKGASGNPIVFNDVSPRIIVGAGATYKIIEGLELSINVRNLFNTSYYQSGMATGLVRQQGRWFIADFSYKF